MHQKDQPASSKWLNQLQDGKVWHRSSLFGYFENLCCSNRGTIRNFRHRTRILKGQTCKQTLTKMTKKRQQIHCREEK